MMQLWSSNTDGIHLDELGRHLLAVVGPSGSGKTAISAAIAHRYPDARVIPIYTTRRPRQDDAYGHYRYVSDDEFSELGTRKEFFICRNAPVPKYGWRRDDVLDAVANGQFAIVLFRQGGAKLILEILPMGMIVLIEPHPEIASLRSTGRIKTDGEHDIAATIRENRTLGALAEIKGWPVKVLTNSFLGPDELEIHARSIAQWAKELQRR
jgi:guanylate kinase